MMQVEPAGDLQACSRKKRKVITTRRAEPKWLYSFLHVWVYVCPQDELKSCSLEKLSNLSRSIKALCSKGLTLPKEKFDPLPLATER